MYRFCLPLFFLLLQTAWGLILETETLADIHGYLEEKTLVIFDIDNTLIAPIGILGSDQWAWARVKELKAKGLSEKEAFHQTMEEWRQLHANMKMQTLEKDTAALVQNLQALNYPLIALTTRTPEDASLTRRELVQVGIDLKRTAIADGPLELALQEKAAFIDGILFISLENAKGDALKEFLHQTAYLPAKIIFIDDKLSHIKSVEKACFSLGLDFVGLRYGAADNQL